MAMGERARFGAKGRGHSVRGRRRFRSVTVHAAARSRFSGPLHRRLAKEMEGDGALGALERWRPSQVAGGRWEAGGGRLD